MDNTVLLEPRATLTVMKIPGCQTCHIPPQDGKCPRCGHPTPPPCDMQTVTAEVLNG